MAISFRGKPYVKETLLEVPNESDSDSDSDSHDDSGSEDEDEDRSAIDEHDNDIKPASTVWFAGRYVPPSSILSKCSNSVIRLDWIIKKLKSDTNPGP